MEVNIAVIGGGYWGKNLIRNFQALGHLHTICDASMEALNEFNDVYPDVNICTDYQEVLNNKEINAVVIAAPAVLHFELAKKAILHGKDVYVEKPLALNAQDGEVLVKLAKEKDRILMVGHLLHYHPAINELKRLVSSGELGKIQYIYSNRLNFGKIRREENILWSFAPHDISVILGLLGEEPTSISATGSRHLSPDIDDTTVSQLAFANGVNAHIFVSWLHPFKEQKLVVVGEKQMAVFDDMLPWDEKLTLYPHKVVWLNHLPQAEKAQGNAVKLVESEPLKNECQHFAECVHRRQQPKTDGKEGLRVLKVLNSLQESLNNNGKKVEINSKENDYFAHETAAVDQSATIGKGTKVWHLSHIMKNTHIGESCSFGQNCVIGPNVTIGNGVKVQNNISIYDGVEIEDDVFLGPSMVFTNVTNPRSFIVRKDEFKKTLLKKGCSVGANATVVCGTTLGEYSFIGAGSVVTKDVKPYAMMYGVPAKQQGWVSKAGNKLTFDKNGIATDAEDNTSYLLKDDEVSVMSLEEVREAL